MISWEDLKIKLIEFWHEYRRFKIGLAGLALLIIVVSIAVGAWIFLPKEAFYEWNTWSEWAKNPKRAPPEWVNMFSSIKYTPPQDFVIEGKDVSKEKARMDFESEIKNMVEQLRKVMEEQGITDEEKFAEMMSEMLGIKPPVKTLEELAMKILGIDLEELEKKYKGRFIVYIINYDYQWDVPTQDIIIRFKEPLYITAKKTINKTEIAVMITFMRPDGLNITASTKLGNGTDILYPLGIIRNDRQAKMYIMNDIIRKYDKEAAELSARELESYVEGASLAVILFSKAGDGMIYGKSGSLRGKYVIHIEFIAPENTTFAKIPEMNVRFVGSCYGLLGTDVMGRDLFMGIAFGAGLALAVGIAYAVSVVLIGLFYGTTSAYLGGLADEIMQRINEIVLTIPVLPILILVAYYLRSIGVQLSVWHVIGVYILLAWSGSAIVVRSMALQIKAQPYIEAARAVGASGVRIVTKYMLPQLIPYAFASMALAVPAAILIEAGLSFLGLGESRFPTWGRILQDAHRLGAITDWWWIIPPGIMIMVTSLAFVFIGNALDTILNPKLRR